MRIAYIGDNELMRDPPAVHPSRSRVPRGQFRALVPGGGILGCIRRRSQFLATVTYANQT